MDIPKKSGEIESRQGGFSEQKKNPNLGFEDWESSVAEKNWRFREGANATLRRA